MSRIKEDYEEVFEGLSIKEDNIKKFRKLSKKPQNIFYYIKIIVLVVFGVLVLALNFFNHNLFTFKIKDSFIQDNFWYLLVLAIIIHILISLLIHFIAFKSVENVYFKKDDTFGKKELIQYIKGKIIRLKLLGLAVLTPDYMLASYFKERFKIQLMKNKGCECKANYKDKDELCIQCYDSLKFMNKFFIKFSNWLNVIVTVFLGIVILIILAVGNFPYKSFFIASLFLIMLYRLFSRSLEVVTAFYKDVVKVNAKIFYKGYRKIYLHGWRNSYIRKPMRISLAVHTILELLLMFVFTYMLTFVVFHQNIPSKPSLDNIEMYSDEWNANRNTSDMKHNMKEYELSEQVSKVYDYIDGNHLYEFFLYTISVSFFNISFINYSFWLWNLLHVWQVTVSTIMIVLCIASYLGFDDDMFKRERDFFAEVFKKDNKN
ncbi:hypothetical protein ACS2Q2_13690 [Bacillus cereus group sp. Bce009]|uniref:hypothetical protein n=1 Tax=Bacillus cereus group sp. Bce009 TaxID=3445252 RepID=UPI003F1EB83E